MSDKVKKILKWVGVGMVAAGCAFVWIGGGDASYVDEIVTTVFAVIAAVGILFKAAG